MSRPWIVKKIMENEHRRKLLQQSMARLLKNPNSAFVKGRDKYLRSKRNPFKNPSLGKKLRAASIKANRKNGWIGLTGGNGTPIPKPQRILADTLGWLTEVVVPTGKRRPGIPPCYKLDIANSILKVGIEVDGKSHLCSRRKLEDQKKTKILKSLGWTILRVTNEEVMNDPKGVAKKLLARLKS